MIPFTNISHIEFKKGKDQKLQVNSRNIQNLTKWTKGTRRATLYDTVLTRLLWCYIAQTYNTILYFCISATVRPHLDLCIKTISAAILPAIIYIKVDSLLRAKSQFSVSTWHKCLPTVLINLAQIKHCVRLWYSGCVYYHKWESYHDISLSCWSREGGVYATLPGWSILI